MALWTPTALQTRAWYDFADTSTVSVANDTVASIADKSGSGYHLSQPTAANRPAYVFGINGKNVAWFDGVNDSLPAPVPLLGTTHSLFVVFCATPMASIGSVLGQYAPGQAGRFMLATNQACSGSATPGRLNPFNGSATQGSCTGAGAGLLADIAMPQRAMLVESICTTGAAQWKIYSDGALLQSGAVSVVYQGANSALGGASAAAGSGYPYSGVIGELIILSSVVDTGTRQKIEGYLAHKWGFATRLPQGHPYAASAPTVTGGDTYLIAGTTRLDGAPVSARVLLLDSSTGELRATAQSDPTGAYQFQDASGDVMAPGEEYLLLCDYGEGVRPLAHGPIEPDVT